MSVKRNIIHPIVNVIERTCRAWSDATTAGAQARQIARDLFDAGMVRNAELSHGLVMTIDPERRIDIPSPLTSKPDGDMVDMVRALNDLPSFKTGSSPEDLDRWAEEWTPPKEVMKDTPLRFRRGQRVAIVLVDNPNLVGSQGEIVSIDTARYRVKIDGELGERLFDARNLVEIESKPVVGSDRCEPPPASEKAAASPADVYVATGAALDRWAQHYRQPPRVVETDENLRARIVDAITPSSSRCEPPPEHREMGWHWLRCGTAQLPVQWHPDADMWHFSGRIANHTPEELTSGGWRYVAPCEEPKT